MPCKYVSSSLYSLDNSSIFFRISVTDIELFCFISLLEYLEYLSRDFTLYPGDVISGGTAAGTAADSSELLPDRTSAPERFLKPGDVVEMRSPSIGSLRTRVVGKRK